VQAIFIFTKDRVHTFKLTFERVRDFPYPLFVIDDSVDKNNRRVVEETISGRDETFYCNNESYQLFLRQKQVICTSVDLLCGQLGNFDWNLGLARNYALMIAQSGRFEKVLFMDDDIIVHDRTLPDRAFKLLDHHLVVGAHITGLTDNSITGHIASAFSISTAVMVSGGFMAFKPDDVQFYFMNIYNEDWIWQFINGFASDLSWAGEAEHIDADKWSNGVSKACFQEFGELALDCASAAFEAQNWMILSESDFIGIIKATRRTYLLNLTELARIDNKPELARLLDVSEKQLEAISPKALQNHFNRYFEQNTLLRSYFPDERNSSQVPQKAHAF